MMGLWTQAAIGLLVGLLPGLLLLKFLASPLCPRIPILSTILARVLLTVSQFIRGQGVLVKRDTGEYEIGTYVNDIDGKSAVKVSDKLIKVDSNSLTWGLFGKKNFGLTWEPGTELHQRMRTGERKTDGGKGYEINMAAAHRYLKGSNESQAIDRTKEHAEAQFGGGNQGLGTKLKIAYVVLMLILGVATTFLAMG